MFLKSKSKSDAPPYRERPIAVLMGDAEPPLITVEERHAAAALPDNLSVTIQGTSRARAVIAAAGVLLAAIVARIVFRDTLVASAPLLAVGSVAVGAAGLRLFARERREYRLTEEGLEMETRSAVDPRPRVRRIPFRYVEDFTVSVTPAGATLHVLSVSGHTITLHDRPPRLATRELIRRFVENAAPFRRRHHPREGLAEALAKSPPELRALLASADEIPRLRTVMAPILAGMGAVVFTGVTSALDWSPGLQAAVGAGIGATILLAWLWLKRDDPGAEWSDRPWTRGVARLRKRLRRLLDIR